MMNTFYSLQKFIFLTLFSMSATVGWGQTTLYSDDFTGEDNKGKIGTSAVDTAGVAWGIDVSDGEFTASSDYFAVQTGVFEAQDVDGNVIWASEVFSITGAASLNFSFDALADGDFEAGSDIFDVEILIDGAPQVLFSGTVDEAAPGDPMFFGPTELTATLQNFSTSIPGSGIEAYIRITANNNAGTELYGWDNLEVTGTLSGNNCNLTASNLSNITCFDNGTPSDASDDYIEFDLDPSGTDLGANGYTVSTSTSGVTLSPTSGSYGSATTFSSINSTGWNAGDGDITITIDDVDSTMCELTEVITDPGTCSTPPTPTAFINEFHYDNDGADVGEFVEVALLNSFSGMLSDITVTLYNGNGGSEYESQSLDQFTVGSSADGFTLYTWYPSSIQNGAPDGLAIDYQGTVIEFLSYEGFFTATNGPANGLTSSDVGVSETGSTPIGQSLQRIGDCDGENCPSGLTWTGPIAETPGERNTDQLLPVEWLSFTAQQVAAPDAVQLDWSVAWEEMHDYYEVQHSTDGIRWEPIGRVQEDNQPQDAEGRSPVKNYDFLHADPETGLNLYRIRQVDLDGAQDYSVIQRVLFSGTETDFSFAPNPARDRLYFTWPLDLQQQSVEMELISMQGQSQTLYRGETPGQLRLPQLAAGMYQLLVRDASGAIISRERVVIQ
jgi:hypothetical protein